MTHADNDSRAARPAELADAKRLLRERTATARALLGAEARHRAAADAAVRLLELPDLAQAHLVLGYFALPAEIDPLPVLSALRQLGATIAYPRIDSPGQLSLHAVDDEGDLVPGTFGLSEPVEDAPMVSPADVDLVVVPGVAFDALGARLGYGGGYYDRLLPRLRSDCRRIALAFDEQLVPEIPAEQHDVRVDLIVTPTRVIRPAARP